MIILKAKYFPKLHAFMLCKLSFLLAKMLTYKLTITAVTFFQAGYLLNNLFSSWTISISLIIYSAAFLVVPFTLEVVLFEKLSADTYNCLPYLTTIGQYLEMSTDSCKSSSMIF